MNQDSKDQQVIEKEYLLVRKEIFDILIKSIEGNVTNYNKLKLVVPNLEDICTSYYKGAPIPDEISTKDIFRYFCMIWRPAKVPFGSAISQD